MTRNQAIQALHKGQRVSHFSLLPFYIYKINGKLYNDTGDVLEWADFWRHKHYTFFDTGWLLYG